MQLNIIYKEPHVQSHAQHNVGLTLQRLLATWQYQLVTIDGVFYYPSPYFTTD